MANAFVHVELHTGDVAKAKQFYSKLFGWKLEDMPMPGGGTYTMIQVGEGTGGGMMSARPPGVSELLCPGGGEHAGLVERHRPAGQRETRFPVAAFQDAGVRRMLEDETDLRARLARGAQALERFPFRVRDRAQQGTPGKEN